jgi:hypothetical protein
MVCWARARVPVALLLLVLAYRPVARDLSRRRPPARAFL